MYAKRPAGACLVLGIAALLGACQGGQTDLPQQLGIDSSEALVPAEITQMPVEASLAGFELQVLPDSFLTEGSSAEFGLDSGSPGTSRVVAERKAANDAGTPVSDILVTISAREAVDLRALYCDLRYDPARYTPLGVEHLAWDACVEHLSALDDDSGAAIPGRQSAGNIESRAGTPAPLADGTQLQATSGDGLLTLEVLSAPGVVHLGQVLAHWDQRQGLTGDAQLARVRFAARPFVAQNQQRNASGLTSPGAACKLFADGFDIMWEYYLPGDYNQDGLVGVSDLTPLGLHYQERSTGLYGGGPQQFLPSSIDAVIDGNGDGWITINDITPIGINFGAHIDGYRLMRTDGRSAYPDSGQAILNIDFSQRQGNMSRERCWFETFSGMASGVVWVQPFSAGESGTPSNYARFGESFARDFSLDVGRESYYYKGTANFSIRPGVMKSWR